jgi:hypothetical protein
LGQALRALVERYSCLVSVLVSLVTHIVHDEKTNQCPIVPKSQSVAT